MTKEQKTDLIVEGAIAVVLLGLGLVAAKGVYEDLKASGALEKSKRDAVDMAKKLAADATRRATEAADAVAVSAGMKPGTWVRGGGSA